MEYRKLNDTYVVRLDRGEEIMECLTALSQKEGLLLAEVTGLGAADHCVVGLYDVEEHFFHKKAFDCPLEIASLMGSITQKDGAPYLHLHATVCDKDHATYGGHLVECRISATAELFVRTLPGSVGRRLGREITGLNLFAFE